MRNSVVYTITLSGTTPSAALDVRDYRYFSFHMPATITSTAITFKGCPTNEGTFNDLYADGTQVSLTVAAARVVGLSDNAQAFVLAGQNFIKLVPGTSEGSARTVHVVCKK